MIFSDNIMTLNCSFDENLLLHFPHIQEVQEKHLKFGIKYSLYQFNKSKKGAGSNGFLLGLNSEKFQLVRQNGF